MLPVMSTPRERSSNFTNDETDRLLDITAAFKTVVENKKLDGVSVKRKIKAWKKISTIFNASRLNVYRSDKTLKLKYEAMKKSLRKKLGHPKDFTVNGDDTFVRNLLTDLEIKLYNMLSSNFEPPPGVEDDLGSLDDETSDRNLEEPETLSICETKREYNADETPNTSSQKQLENDRIPNEIFFNSINNEAERITPSEEKENWSKSSSSPKSSDAKVTQKPISSKKLSLVAKAKLELLNLQADILRIERENKSVLLRNAEQVKEQEDYLKIKILQVQLDGLISENDRQQQEHMMKMKLLELEIKQKELDLKLKENSLRNREYSAIENGFVKVANPEKK